MTTLNNEKNDSCTLHIGTATALGAIINLDTPGSEESGYAGGIGLPQWCKVTKNLREQFDLDRDLRGYAIARIWGLASYRGVIAVLVSRHPTNMIQYKVASDERTVVGFTFEGSDQALDIDNLFSPSLDSKTPLKGNAREKPVIFLLSQCEKSDELNEADQRLIYAAACCSIVDESLASTRDQAQRAFERLSVKTGADLSEEMSKCTSIASTISSKSPDQLANPGAHLFEKCEVCDAGIPWVSTTEAQCENGHLFGM